ncbi:MAG: hypothetical protein C0582_01905 [Alphaproteobacteria bacterium]|nr:MAG: hypothetical protein C0582_01905 [Alphaproteobacteria bacterium]
MANKQDCHSEETKTDFSVHLSADIRNFWWSDGYKKFFAENFDLKSKKMALDVGCGAGHSTQFLAGLCGSETEILGVDANLKILETAKERSQSYPNISYQPGEVCELPFDSNTFDLVFCQTLLIHVHDVTKALDEIKRVLKPGGLAILAETNNTSILANANSALRSLSHEEGITLIDFFNHVVAGKKYQEGGDITIAYMLESMARDVGFCKVTVCRNDKVLSLYPPYSTPEEQANLNFIKAMASQNYLLFSPEDCQKFYPISNPNTDQYKQGMEIVKKLNQIYLEQISNQTFVGSFGAEMIITIGQKAS